MSLSTIELNVPLSSSSTGAPVRLSVQSDGLGAALSLLVILCSGENASTVLCCRGRFCEGCSGETVGGWFLDWLGPGCGVLGVCCSCGEESRWGGVLGALGGEDGGVAFGVVCEDEDFGLGGEAGVEVYDPSPHMCLSFAFTVLLISAYFTCTHCTCPVSRYDMLCLSLSSKLIPLIFFPYFDSCWRHCSNTFVSILYFAHFIIFSSWLISAYWTCAHSSNARRYIHHIWLIILFCSYLTQFLSVRLLLFTSL